MNEYDNIVEQVDSLKQLLHQLQETYKVHAAAELGYRDLQTEKLETLKLAMQHRAAILSSEIVERFEGRILTLENRTTEHITGYQIYRQREEDAARDKRASDAALKTGMVLLALTQLMQLIIMGIGYLVLRD